MISLQRHRDGVAAGLRTALCGGRYEVITAGPNVPEFGFIGADPFNTNVGTGLVVPSTPSAAIGNARYLMLLARVGFDVGEAGVRLVGIRQYVELIARVPGPNGTTTVFRREIQQPLWHPPDGNITWHVMMIPKGFRDTRNPANGDGVMFQDSTSPALLFQTLAPYTPPNAGRPWGTPLKASLGNIRDLRYPYRSSRTERELDIPVPLPIDIGLFVSVRQNDPATNPTTAGLTADQFSALTHEDRFLTAFASVAQYGVIAGSLVFSENLAEDVP